VIRLLTIATGIITTVAGTGTAGYSGNGGAATSAMLNVCRGIAVNSAGVYYIADFSNNRIRTVTNGVIHHLLSQTTPEAIGLDTSGNVYFAMPSSNIVKKYTVSTGVTTTVAGTGKGSSTGDGSQATSATINLPAGAAVDASGNVYIGEYSGCRVRKVTISTGVISTLAGTGSCSFSGLGLELGLELGLGLEKG
jgi:hypothetical protein